METLYQDLRYGARMLVKGRAVTAVAIIALALGIGANTAIFSVVNTVLLRPLPYKNADQLVMIWETNSEVQIGFDLLPVSIAAFADWRNQCESFEAISILDAERFAFTGSGVPERVGGASVSAGFFDLMSVTPILGRVFSPEEDKPGANTVVVISHALWQSRFGADKDVCGRTIMLDGRSYTIIGVMPKGFQFPRVEDLPPYFQASIQSDMWTPIGLTGEQLANRGSHNKSVIARLKPGFTVAQAQAEIEAISNRIAGQYPEARGWGAKVLPIKEQLVGNLRVALFTLLGAVGFVLLIACANVANLLLARATSRQKEIAVRTALGATRWRIVRQLLTESVILSLAGGVIGVLLAVWGVNVLLAISPSNIPRKYEISIDGYVLAFTFAVSLVTGILFGLAPAFQVSRFNLSETLKESARGSTAGNSPLRSLLVVAEVALALVLLIGAGLLLNSFSRLSGINPGFNPTNVLTMKLDATSSDDDDPKQARIFQQIIEKVKALPGVESAGAVSDIPLSGGEEIDQFTVEGSPAPTNYNDTPLADFRFIDEGYFSTLKIPLVAGRDFSERDTASAPPVVIISESLARRFYRDEQAVGHRLKAGDFESRAPLATIVGVAKDVKHTTLEQETRPQLYFPYQQKLWGRLTIVARSQSDVSAAMRNAVWEVDKDQPITSFKMMDEYLADSVSQKRFNAILLAAFAVVAMLLASVGIYGVMSYTVTQRTHEIGIRIALGAKQRDVFKLVVGQGLKLTLAGVGLGLSAAFALTRLMESLLYNVSATDPATFIVISIILAGVALGACFMPARRATKVDPMVALRYE
ncbi:MAG: ABC transporter permease [Blastocatellia bacterium]